MRQQAGKYIGQQFGTYRLVRLIGRGGFADVYLGEHIHLNTQAAVKILRTQLTEDQAANFKKEAQIVARMQHPNIVRVLEFDIEETADGAIPFLVMEHAPDGSLADFRPRGIRLPWVSIESYLRQVASALQYAHDHKLIHRDVKPNNMLLRNDYKEIVLTDFGIALIIQSTGDIRVEAQGAIGTPWYMAPEQIQSKAVPASDQYALGIVVYEWLTGDVPFQGTHPEIINHHLHAPVPALPGEFSTAVNQALMKALAKDPASRYASIQEFADALIAAYHAAQKTTQYPNSFVRAAFASEGTHLNNHQHEPGQGEPSLPDRSTTGHALIAHYHEVALDYYRLLREYERKKQDFLGRFHSGKDAIERTLQTERANANWQLEQIRQSFRRTRRALETSRWKALLLDALPAPAQVALVNNAAQQITHYTNTLQGSGSKIRSLLNQKTLLKRIRTTLSPYVTQRWFPLASAASIFIFLLVCIVWWGPGLWTVLLLLLLLVVALFITDNRMARNATGQIKQNYITFTDAFHVLEQLYVQRDGQLQAKCQRDLAVNYSEYTQRNANLDRGLQAKVSELQQRLAMPSVEVRLLTTDWNDPLWQQWKPVENTVSYTRLGTWKVQGNTPFPPIPALVACPGGENIIFKVSGHATTLALSAIHSLMLRILTSQPPGKVLFTLIDPVGLGDNVAMFMQLADHDEKLVNSKVWSEPPHIEKQLADLSDHMGNVIQKYLRNQFETIDDYNAAAGELAEPYRILVVIGFPRNFTPDALRRIASIITSGPRCGVSTLMVLDSAFHTTRSLNLSELERHANVIAWDGQQFVWQNTYDDIRPSQLILDALPPPNLFQSLLKTIGERVKETERIAIPFRRMVEQLRPEESWWTASNDDGIASPLGPTGATKYQYLRLGKGTAHHALVVGKTGSGKTNLLQVLIVGLCLAYSPRELELYLIDFKTVGFTNYAKYKLPHARVVAIQSEREFGLSVLRGLDEEMERRKIVFSGAGVQEIAQYRHALPMEYMPRILLLVDEFQEFFNHEDAIARDAEAMLDKLVRMGRAFGIHVILGSQTLAGIHTLPRSTISQMAVRIALQCEEADSRLILSEDNTAARLLSRPGEAIYNAENGSLAGNNTFQCVWLPDEEIQVYLNAVQQLAQRNHAVVQRTQNIFDGSKNANINDNQQLKRILFAPTWQVSRQAPSVWLGNPIDIKDPTSFQLLPQAGSNLLIVGQQPDLALSLLIISLLCLMAQRPPDVARFVLLDFTPNDSPHVGLLDWLSEQLPHTVNLFKRRDLPSAITTISQELAMRKELENEKRPEVYLCIFGLQRARDLRQEEHARSQENAPTLHSAFSTIVRDGPDVGIHTLAWCDTFTNVSRTLENGTLREFELRVAFQMSSDDSSRFVDSTLANKLKQHRAVLYNEETGHGEVFIPYDIPSREWLSRAIERIQKKTSSTAKEKV